MSKENENKMQPMKTPLEDLRQSALEHYREASSKMCHWNSFVESAIMAYNPEASHQPKEGVPDVNTRIKHWTEVFKPKEDKPEWEIVDYDVEHWNPNWDKSHPIKSVRRNSDGIVFSVGDEVQVFADGGKGFIDTINHFTYTSGVNIVDVYFKNNMAAFNISTWLKDAKKSKPKEEVKEPERDSWYWQNIPRYTQQQVDKMMEDALKHQKLLSIEDIMNLSDKPGFEYVKYLKPKLIEIIQKNKTK